MILINEQYDMSKKSFIHVGGVVKEYIECDDLIQIKKYLTHRNFIAISNTSKILFSFDKSEVSYVCFIKNKIVFFEKSYFVYSGVSLNYLNHILMKKQITGFEYLSTIPGLVGGSIINNSSFLNQCISDSLIRILVFENGNFFFINKEDIIFKYRYSSLKKNNFLIIGAEFSLKKDIAYQIKKKFEYGQSYRKKFQDLKSNTLGSTFKNGNGYIIGKVLDELKYKGYVFNENLRISNIHSNFILIKPHTNYREINNFINFLKEVLYNYLKEEIKEEIQIIYSDGTRN